jgi:UDP-N-acetylmuramoylalanine--D-glutamate ligase
LQEGLNSFVNDPHRLEKVATINGVDYINDSKATNVDSTFWALDAMHKKIVWIVGGQDKGNDYSVLLPLVKSKVKAIVGLGVDNSKIISYFNPYIKVIVDTKSINDAIEYSSQLAENGDVVLLSPACASFDLFKNYMDRGDQFKTIINQKRLKEWNQ